MRGRPVNDFVNFAREMQDYSDRWPAFCIKQSVVLL